MLVMLCKKLKVTFLDMDNFQMKVVSRDNFKHFISSRKDKGLILCALNLFMLGYIKRHSHLIGSAVFWCDGIMGSVFCYAHGKYLNKYRGISVVKDLLLEHRNSSVAILGSADSLIKNYFFINSVEVREHIKLENFELSKFDILSFNLDAKYVFITLPSPKQEQLAFELARHYPTHHFYCVGGALNMLSDPSLDCPYIFRILGLEFLYRLRSDTRRRIKRLFNSIYQLICNFFWLKNIDIFEVE